MSAGLDVEDLGARICKGDIAIDRKGVFRFAEVNLLARMGTKGFESLHNVRAIIRGSSGEDY